MYFDPYLEEPSVRYLTAPERADRLTRPLSVSALVEVEVDADYVVDHNQLFLEGPHGS